VDETIDYREVGLKVGLEVHQQLLTQHKMFCHCPAGLYTNTHDGEVLRHMRPTLSELGEYDGTALMEFKTKKNIVYLLHQDNTCTYEMDDTPPFLMDPQAVDIAIEQCLMLGCDIVDEVHIARKQYLDGSIPTGFQRSAIVGVNGRLPFADRELEIIQVSVEEDSCREVLDRGHLVVWRTDRLGMPLIETVTGPDLRTPAEVEQAILLIGRVCRSTGHVRVGLGASRQDVNVSVTGGHRVEIKGVPKAGWAPALVHGEAVRQCNLLELRDELRRRGFSRPDKLGVEDQDVTAMCATSQLDFFRESAWAQVNEVEGRRYGFDLGAGPFCVRAVRLPGLARTLSWPTQPELTFAHELAGRVRVIATLDIQPILIHGEKWPDYDGALQELKQLRTRMCCGPDDGLIVVRGAEEDTLTAAQEIRNRYADAVLGVPPETRQPMSDGSTGFERILPGPDRMYPDTDSPPQRVTRERVAEIQVSLPEPPWVREQRYCAAGVPRQLVHYLIRRGGARLVDLVVHRCGADLRQACFFFGEKVRGLRRAGVLVDELSDERWSELFAVFADKPELQQAWRRLVTHAAAEPQRPIAELLEMLTLGVAPQEWHEQLGSIVSTLVMTWPDGTREQRQRFLMGRAMAGLRGRVPAAAVLARLERLLGAAGQAVPASAHDVQEEEP